MSKHKYSYISGPELLSLLSVTVDPIKWIELGGTVLGHIPASQACLIVKAGSFIGKCSKTRVLYIREVENRKEQAPDPSYWDGRACGLYRWPDTPVTRRSADLWTKAAQQSSRLEVV